MTDSEVPQVLPGQADNINRFHCIAFGAIAASSSFTPAAREAARAWSKFYGERARGVPQPAKPPAPETETIEGMKVPAIRFSCEIHSRGGKIVKVEFSSAKAALEYFQTRQAGADYVPGALSAWLQTAEVGDKVKLARGRGESTPDNMILFSCEAGR